MLFKATITHVTSSGFTARLNNNGLTGFVDLRKDPEKFSYDKWTASLTSTTRRFHVRSSRRPQLYRSGPRSYLPDPFQTSH